MKDYKLIKSDSGFWSFSDNLDYTVPFIQTKLNGLIIGHMLCYTDSIEVFVCLQDMNEIKLHKLDEEFICNELSRQFSNEPYLHNIGMAADKVQGTMAIIIGDFPWDKE